MEYAALVEYGLPVLFALFLWWFSTGLVLILDGLPRNAARLSLAAVTGIAIAALYGLVRASQVESVTAAYAGFVCALLVWGWQELSFLTGWITGPRKHACVPGCRGWLHFVHAVQAILYHEAAILVAGVAIVALTWNAPNQVGTWTYLVLWLMRISAKLNLFLGVRNTGEEFLPEHLHYLKSFFRRRRMNLLFPISVTAPTVLATLMVESALDSGTPPAAATGLVLVAALLGLAIVEHWMMVLPVRVAALWEWAMRTHRRERVDAASVTPPERLAPWWDIASRRGF
jgi:putative photosynthetic complex assembly protein 2